MMSRSLAITLTSLLAFACAESNPPRSDAGAGADGVADAGGAGAGDTGATGDAAGQGEVTDPDGPRFWLRSFGGAWRDELRDVSVNPSGDAWLLGTTESAGAGNWDAWLLRVDACGQPVAGWTLGGAGKDAGVALGRLSSGDLVVVGDTESFESALEVFVTRITLTGQVGWSAAVGGSGWDAAVDVTATSDDGVVVLGETYNFGPGAPKTHNLLVFSLDSGGKLRWEQTLGGGVDGDAGFGLLREKDDGVVIVGATESYGNGRDDVWLLRLDATGKLLWARTYGGEEDDEGRAIAADGSGGYWLSGFSRGWEATKSDAFLLHVDGNGDPLRLTRYGDTGKERGYALLPDAGGLTMLGVTDSIDGYDDGYALRLDADGEVVWMKRIGSDKYDDVRAATAIPGKKGDLLWVGATESYGNGGREAWYGRIRADGEGGCKVRAVESPWERRSVKLPVAGKMLPEVAHGAVRRSVEIKVSPMPAAPTLDGDLRCLSPACPKDLD